MSGLTSSWNDDLRHKDTPAIFSTADEERMAAQDHAHASQGNIDKSFNHRPRARLDNSNSLTLVPHRESRKAQEQSLS
jgi:hypothetical protein